MNELSEGLLSHVLTLHYHLYSIFHKCVFIEIGSIMPFFVDFTKVKQKIETNNICRTNLI